MKRSILITSQEEQGDGYSIAWKGKICTVTHDLGGEYVATLLDESGIVCTYPAAIEENKVEVEFDEPIAVTDIYRLNLVSYGSPETTADYVIGEYYSGTVENVLRFCKSLDLSSDKLRGVSPERVELMQRLVDDHINDTISEYYFVPLRPYNQVQPDGSVRKVFPGKIRMIALQWTAGLLLQTEFQSSEPNMNEQARLLVEEAKKETQQIVDFSTRIAGQRRKHPSPTMPPNLAPSKTNEFQL